MAEETPAQTIAALKQQLAIQTTLLELKTESQKPSIDHQGLKEFNPGRDISQVGQRWDNWLQQWELYLASQGLNEKHTEGVNTGEYKATNLKPLFLLKIGEEARMVYNGKRNAEGNDKLSAIIKFMTEHFKPKRSLFAYVSIFYKAKRLERESVNDFVTRLRHLAKPCQFEAQLENELLKVFVFGCGIEKVEKMMTSHDNKTLQDAIECGLTNEHQLEDLQQIRSLHTQESNSGGTINSVNQEKPSTSNNISYKNPQKQSNLCSWCGNERHARQQCPAKGKKCNKCGKEGHYGKVCRQTNSQLTGNGTQTETRKQFSKMKNTNSSKAISNNQITERFQLTIEEYDEYQQLKKLSEWDEYNMNMVYDNSKSTDPNPFTRIEINDTTLQVMVDTGAAVNTINESSYNRLTNKPKLEQFSNPLFGFGSPNKPLTTMGKFKTNIKWKNTTLNTMFVVMKGNQHQDIIGRKAAVALGMVTFNLELSNLNQISIKTKHTKEELKAIYPKLFSGKLGCAKDTEVKLEIDKSIKPIKQPLRPIAFHLREAVEKELDKQVAEGILEKVEFGTKPITWISNLVVIPKEKLTIKEAKSIESNKSKDLSNLLHLYYHMEKHYYDH
jgi:hypothetical protein